MHNILQGVAKPEERISLDERKMMIDWITENANRYWFSKGGPLRPAEEGGADVVVVCKQTPSDHYIPFWIYPNSFRALNCFT